MKLRIRILTLLLVCLSLLACVFLRSGCSRKPRPVDLPKLYQCQITILDKEGKPLQNATVSVNPEDSTTNKWGASGGTNASGVADILTAGQFRGLPVGKYRVTIRHYENISTGELNEFGQEIFQTNNLVPMEYSLTSKTPFHFEMEPKAMNLTFQMEKY